jgi:anti-sigma factor RsiW
MSCPFEEDLTAYVDAELPPARRVEVETHLRGCAECQGTEALLRRTLARLAEPVAWWRTSSCWRAWRRWRTSSSSSS